MSIKKDIFLLQYADLYPDCPPYLSGEFNCPEFEWEPLDPNAANAVIEKDYVFKSDLEYINFDYYGSLRIVSRQFLDVCDGVSAGYRSVPLEIILTENKKSEKNYFFLLVKDHISVIDRGKSVFEDAKDPRNKSVFEDAKDPRTGDLIVDKIYPDSYAYDKIDSFVQKDIDFPPLFVCIETGDVFCTEIFKVNAEKLSLRGVSFKKIDSEYKYDPFAEFS